MSAISITIPEEKEKDTTTPKEKETSKLKRAKNNMKRKSTLHTKLFTNRPVSTYDNIVIQRSSTTTHIPSSSSSSSSPSSSSSSCSSSLSSSLSPKGVFPSPGPVPSSSPLLFPTPSPSSSSPCSAPPPPPPDVGDEGGEGGKKRRTHKKMASVSAPAGKGKKKGGGKKKKGKKKTKGIFLGPYRVDLRGETKEEGKEGEERKEGKEEEEGEEREEGEKKQEKKEIQFEEGEEVEVRGEEGDFFFICKGKDEWVGLVPRELIDICEEKEEEEEEEEKEVKEEEGEEEAQRRKIVGEILSTEEAYLTSLSKIIDIYKSEFLRRSKDENSTLDLSSQQMNTIFANVDPIRTLSLTMCERLRERMESWSKIQQIGDIFVKVAPVMIIYTEYANAYEGGLQVYLKERKRSKIFEQVVLDCKAKAEVDLEHLLIMPVQRIPRYNLLLSDLIKHTNPDHPDYVQLEQALEVCQAMAIKINDCMRQTEKVKEMLGLAEKNSLFSELLCSNRQLKVQQHSNCTRTILYGGEGVEKEKGLALVFNDLFVYVPKKALAAPEPMKHSYLVPLNLVWLLENDSSSCTLLIPGYSLSLSVDDKKEKANPGLVRILVSSMNDHMTNYWTKTWLPAQERQQKKEEDHSSENEEGIYSVSWEQLEGNLGFDYRHGKFTFPQGAEYEGWWKKGAPQGQGVKTYEDNTYVGNFLNGVKCGHGICDYFTGDAYEGQWSKNMANGSGKLSTLQGDVYIGNFSDNLKKGQGEMKYANGDIFVGEWSNDLPNGSGELTLSNGLFYTGDFKDGQFEGRGVLYSPSGKCYQGTWVSGKRHGMGVMTYADGSTYSGKWAHNKFHGSGTHINKSDGTTYIGEWFFGAREGEGTLKLSNGDVYSGSFRGGGRNGKGYCLFGNQDVYIGQWRNDQLNGRGKLKKNNGVTFDGNFTNGVFDGNGTLTTTTGQISKNFRPIDISKGRLTVDCVPRIMEFNIEF